MRTLVACWGEACKDIPVCSSVNNGESLDIFEESPNMIRISLWKIDLAAV